MLYLKRILNKRSLHSRYQMHKQALIFIPGVFFIIFGLGIVLAPGLLLAIVATLFLSVGVLLFFVAIKFLQFRKKINGIFKSYEGRIYIQGVNLKGREDPSVSSSEEKKIIYH